MHIKLSSAGKVDSINEDLLSVAKGMTVESNEFTIPLRPQRKKRMTIRAQNLSMKVSICKEKKEEAFSFILIPSFRKK